MFWFFFFTFHNYIILKSKTPLLSWNWQWYYCIFISFKQNRRKKRNVKMEPIGVWHLLIQRVLSKTHKILNFSYFKYLFIAKWTFQLHAPFKEILNCIIVARISSAALNHCKKETEMAYVWDPSHIGRLRWLSSNFVDKMCPEWKFSRHGTNL